MAIDLTVFDADLEEITKDFEESFIHLGVTFTNAARFTNVTRSEDFEIGSIKEQIELEMVVRTKVFDENDPVVARPVRNDKITYKSKEYRVGPIRTSLHDVSLKIELLEITG